MRTIAASNQAFISGEPADGRKNLITQAVELQEQQEATAGTVSDLNESLATLKGDIYTRLPGRKRPFE